MLYQSFTDNPIWKGIISTPTSNTFESLFIHENDLDNRSENYKSEIKNSSKLFNHNRDQKTRTQKLSEDRCHLNKNKINTRKCCVENKSQILSSSQKTKIHIIGDSHSRGLAGILHKRNPLLQIAASVYPGACLGFSIA